MEIANQAQIYQNGIVTILADGARSAKEGFLQKRQLLRHRCKIKVRLPGSDCPEVVLVFEFLISGKGTVHGPINSRA